MTLSVKLESFCAKVSEHSLGASFSAKPFKAASPFPLSFAKFANSRYSGHTAIIFHVEPYSNPIIPIYHLYVAKFLKHQSFKASHFFHAKFATSRYSGHTASFDSLESQHLIFTVKPHLSLYSTLNPNFFLNIS